MVCTWIYGMTGCHYILHITLVEGLSTNQTMSIIFTWKLTLLNIPPLKQWKCRHTHVDAQKHMLRTDAREVNVTLMAIESCHVGVER